MMSLFRLRNHRSAVHRECMRCRPYCGSPGQRKRYSVLRCMDATPCDSVEVGKAENVVQFGQNLYPVQWVVLAICLLVSCPLPPFHLSYAFPSRFSSLLFNCPSLLPHLCPLPTCPVSLPHFLLPFPALSCPAPNWFIPFVDHMGICTSSVVNRDSAGPYFVSVSVCVCVSYIRVCMYVAQAGGGACGPP